ncbi:MAG TPA: DUF72 domain-containing protein, partial [Chthoniobacteraceae bacterium]
MNADIDTSKIHLGTCGWSFDQWRGVFYPEHLPPTDRLAFYARHFGSVEIDSTFYGPPSLQTVGHWLDATPETFRFACKLPREITHDRKLRGAGEALDAFLAAMAPLRSKLACLVVQLPPHFTPHHDEVALKEFIRELPRDFRFAVEFRSEEWHLPRIVHLLEAQGVCWIWNDLTSLEEQNLAAFGFQPRTTDFLYVRLMGDRVLPPEGSEAGGDKHLA